ncbi:MAG: GEVED domain-containing protein, partial [Aeromicrobium sp.]|uniref:DUF7507 domain-containing protein n=1 Tax=Aeromicrobium sp. TaxID=1871063 RepID=UPI0039E4AC13
WDGENGASHRIVDLDEDSNTSDLMLGSLVDDEADGTAAASGDPADSDDADGADDEDGLQYPLAITDGVATPVRILVTNNTDEPATLAGWLDLDKSGTFETSELQTIVVPANSGTTEQTLTFPAMTLDADAYARFRLFTGEVSDPLPTGPVIGGEVEDYQAVVADPGLSIEKSSVLNDTNGNEVADVGETLNYSFTVTNTGNVTLTDVVVNDDKVPAAADSPVSWLDPGESTVIGPFPYVVQQADVDSGEVYNSATASGTTPAGESFESDEATDVRETPERVGGLSVVKSAQLNDTNGNGLGDAGEKIVYSFVVTNTGNVTMTGINVEDTKVTGLTPSDFDLAPGATQVVTADPYTITTDDALRGSVDNVATASGTDPMGGTVTSEEAEVSTKTPGPNLPSTGSSISPGLLSLGLLLVLIGGLVIVARRRKTT